MKLLILLFVSGCVFDPAGDTMSTPDAGSELDAAQDAQGGSLDAGTPADAALTAVTLSETTDDAVSIGKAVYCNNGASIRDNAWFRAFKPSDFGVTGALHVTSLDFAAESAHNASVTVALYKYNGTIGGVTLDTSAFVPLASATIAPPDGSGPLSAAITADVAATNVLVVEISAADSVTSTFHLGANGDGQTAEGYYASAACGEGTPSGQSGRDFLIGVEGTY